MTPGAPIPPASAPAGAVRAAHSWVLSVLAALFLGGCCCCFDLGDLELLDDDDEEEEDEPRKKKKKKKKVKGVNIGTATFPKGESDAKVVKHGWKIQKPKAEYQLGYALAKKAAKDLHESYQHYARKVRYRSKSEKSFEWQPPPGCASDMRCVYERLATTNRDAIAVLTELFRARIKSEKLSSLDAARLVITFVQHIRYEIPEKEPFQILPPALVVSESRGDCDSKSLLAALILRSLGVDCVLISSDAHGHTMLGVALPSSGTTFKHRGRRYAFVEVTAKHAPIGYVDRKLLRPNDWRAVALQTPP